MKPVLKGLVGFVLGLGLWWGLTPTYNAVVARPAEMILRVTERPPVTRIDVQGRGLIINREDFPPKSPRPGVPLSDLTFNVALVVALFAASRETFSNRNVVGFTLAMVVLYLTHIAGLVATIKSIYALKLGQWSVATYGPFARNFWGAAEHFYRLVGMYAFGFAVWWVFRPSGTPARLGRGRRRKSH